MTYLLTENRVKEQATWLEIDRSALRYNLSQMIALTLPGASLMAVVKANAYGHGLLEVAGCIRDQVSHFGVASIDEAIALRSREIDQPILLFGVPKGAAIDAAIEHEISFSISSLEQAREISESAARLAKPALIHIKIDTGMGRLGIPKLSALSAIFETSRLEWLKMEGIFTHFPQGSDPADPFTKEQLRIFFKIIEKAAEKGIHFAYRHAANSVGMANFKEAHLNLVRPGLMLYGIYPCKSTVNRLKLKPALSWKARLILVKKLAKGESTGYSRTFVADHDATLGIVPVGYSQGYPFVLSNKGEALFQGKRYPIVGRVSMDYLAINFGHHTHVKAGDVITLMGQEGSAEILCETLAEKAGTIPYEIVTRLHPFIPRMVTGSN